MLNPAEHENLSHALSKNLNEFLARSSVIQKNLVLGVFAPIQKEPHWYLDLDPNYQTAFPAFRNSLMLFRLAKWEELGLSQDFGVEILGPSSKAREVVPDLILVPGVGFSPIGQRLGRGKGFYDRYLELYSGLKIGIGFEMQVEDEIPCEEHDVLMDYLITEKKIYKSKN